MVGSKTILCIEDDHFIAALYKRALEKAGYTVETTVSGESGLELATSKHFDIILLDIMTPDMTGIEVLTKLRGSENKVPNSLILITTNLDQNDATKAQLEHLADGYLIKAEITPSKLVEIVKSMTE